MNSQHVKIVLVLIGTSFAAAAWTQDAETVPAATAENAEHPEDTAATETYAPSLEQCFTVPGHLDMSIFSDRHMYIRTRGNNHYLVTTELCEGLERSYHRGSVQFVPYGRTVCQNDGSYLVYEAQNRELPCTILSIERVQNRAEARSIAENDQTAVEVEAVTPDP